LTPLIFAVCSLFALGRLAALESSHEDFARLAQHHDVLFDLVGNRSLSDCLSTVEPRGTYISCGGGGPDRSSWDLLAGMLQNAVRSAFSSQKMPSLLAKINREDLAILSNLVQRGVVIPVVDSTYSLREVAEAVRHVESGHVHGKVVIAVT
jgi:NADPH:quinone reductase-like Zn-dependent oxidoreductase